ncbi:MAG TPA: TRAP transporter large permease [Amaricoccus sp.]|uniref:TRAP transporter large permease n=1 Tax=Amaricoccus sp. TaxID=1872485 RepID=UPI002B973953|nr:TRAP transporter large permease [Amaricoccus sp.]HMQ92159.1 TRAP transporter large permease [Amaricoccus sp.]HMR53437.1 TRAP transporter large permease [Amaricoccus sp.]HMU00436.1 TRAP transporter large permease [Amaricoccus sp.]
MVALIAIVAVVVLMMIGVPVVFSFAAMTLILTLLYGVDVSFVMTTGFWSVNSVILLALPLFVMTGYLMQTGGIARRLVEFVEALVGKSRKGMGTSMIVSCGIFGAISGTASAAVASIGAIMIDPMERHGYSRGYTSALLGIASLLGLLIPPSITMILYAVVTRQSVAACFLATIGPGILLMIMLAVLNRIHVARKIPGEDVAMPWSERLSETASTGWKALPALMLPVIILGGIYGGFFTPTEAAAIAVVYSIPVGLFVYRELTPRKIAEAVIHAATTTGVIMIILVFSFVASRIFTLERVPQQLTDFLLGAFSSPILILLVVNVFLVLIGMIMDDVSVIAIISPIMVPVMAEIGVDAVHFAAIIGTSVVIGANSPPMAPILFMACRVGKVGMSEVMKPAFFFMAFAAFPVMLVTTYWSPLALTLPRLLGFME